MLSKNDKKKFDEDPELAAQFEIDTLVNFKSNNYKRIKECQQCALI